jgi:hypothetical protein
MGGKIMLKKTITILSTLVILSALSLRSPAMTYAADLNRLADRSEVILFGKALNTKGLWAESSMNILSHTQFRVDICLKGGLPEGDIVTVETYGGIINGIRQKAANSPTFQPGEYALLFLNRGPKDLLVVTDGKEGKILFVEKGKMKTVQEGKDLKQMIKEVKLALER